MTNWDSLAREAAAFVSAFIVCIVLVIRKVKKTIGNNPSDETVKRCWNSKGSRRQLEAVRKRRRITHSRHKAEKAARELGVRGQVE
jgi:hypothetical protein